MAIEASIVVVFGEQEPGADDLVVVEFDPEHSNNLDEGGNLKSTFDPDDRPIILLHHSDTLQVTGVTASSGSVGQVGSNISQSRKKSFQFAKLNETSSLGYDNVSLGSTSWVGNSGVVELINGSVLKLVGGTVPCIGNQTFTVTFQKQYQLTPPTLDLAPDETYEILVVIYMEVI